MSNKHKYRRPVSKIRSNPNRPHLVKKCLYEKKKCITPFPCPFFVLAIPLFIYYTSVTAGTEARTEVK